LYLQVQALDNFISPIPEFEGDIPIPAIPVSAQTPSGDVGSTRTRASKRKAVAPPPTLKKAKTSTGKLTGGIKINKPSPSLPSALTPPQAPQKKVLMRQSNKYA
jgi:hypothetical protein